MGGFGTRPYEGEHHFSIGSAFRKVRARRVKDAAPYGEAIGWFDIVGAAISRPVYSLKFSSPSRRRSYNAIFSVQLLSAAAAQEGPRVAWY